MMAVASFVILAGLYSVHMMEEFGHIISGMNNQIVWGLPHVFAIFLIVAASGVLNVASIGSVFGKAVYKARAPLAGLLSIAMLGGGLSVLMLDLGRPDRIMVAATHFNITSVFAWNIVLYSGMFSLVVVYLWSMMEARMNKFTVPVGFAVFAWRFILTTGTGMIFAFLTARQAYGTAILPPMFIVLSFAWGLAVFQLVQASIYKWNDKTIDPGIMQRGRRLLGVFLFASMFLVTVYHFTNLYFAHRIDFEYFILRDGGIFPAMFWLGYVVLGNIVPLLLIFIPGFNRCRYSVITALLVIMGAFAFLYVFIIGGQSYPLNIFPGYQVSSSFADGQITQYTPSIYELLLGVAGLSIAFMITSIGVRILQFMPHDKPYVAE
jgi:molybdopterin-containing oxidoreductase family membrane subunit